jgi:hypothetical protein
MRRAISFLIGVVSGAMVGAAVAILLAPSSGQELQGQMRSRVQELRPNWRRSSAVHQSSLSRLGDSPNHKRILCIFCTISINQGRAPGLLR